MLLMRANPLLGQVGGGWARKSRLFWAPNGTRPTARCYFTGPKKVSISKAQPLPLALVMDFPASTLHTGPYQSEVHK
jgi:hypothetical protein